MKTYNLLLWIVMGGLFLSACGPERPVAHIPDYPHAQEIQTHVGELANAPSHQRTTFVTSETPEQVIAWYRTELPPHGWEVDQRFTFSPTKIRFDYEPDCRLYVLTIEATRQQPNVTFVQLYLAPYTC